MKYPSVMSEDATLDAALGGVNLARYGDGEINLCLGKDCVSQMRDKGLAAELRLILLSDRPGVLVCIPNAAHPDTKPAWKRWTEDRYVQLYGRGPYGSAFISRPDSAPWIDRPDYWAKVARLWERRHVILVKGTDRSLRAGELPGAASVRVVDMPRRDAYAEVERAEADILAAHAKAWANWKAEMDSPSRPSPPPPPPIVLLCVGATSTVLAHRLAGYDIHAVDVGHLGMFMRHAGSYARTSADLISPAYRGQLVELRKRMRWGDDGAKHADVVDALAEQLGAETILDYGCGEAELAAALKARRRVLSYDPGIAGRDGMPKPCDLIVCTDVLEHVEPDKLAAVLAHIHALMGKGGYFVISTRLANATLPDGRNAHLIVQPAGWWADRISRAGFRLDAIEERGKELRLWVARA